VIGDLATEDGRVAFSSVVWWTGSMERWVAGSTSCRGEEVVGCRIGTRSRVANRDRGHRRNDNANLLRLGRRALKERYADDLRGRLFIGRGMKLLRWSARRTSDGHVASCEFCPASGTNQHGEFSCISKNALSNDFARHGTTRQPGTNPLTCAMPSLSFFQPLLLPRP
jgi:hypothetical protein